MITDEDDGVLLFVEELESVEEILEVKDIVSVGMTLDGEALMVRDCVGDAVDVRLPRDDTVLLPEPDAVLDDVIDDDKVFVDAVERVVEGEDDVVFVDVIERD